MPQRKGRLPLKLVNVYGAEQRDTTGRDGALHGDLTGRFDVKHHMRALVHVAPAVV